ncbi:MAG: NUDIX hydrolase [Magnetococcales bacterium]|nr:NUDIX hydrolase [Magnetococcales bacterium]
MILRPAGLLVEEGRLLCMRYRYGGEDRFNLPGGKPERGEELHGCLVREMAEELTLGVVPGDLVAVAETVASGREVLHLVFQVVREGGQPPRLNPQETSALEVLWLTPEEILQRTLYPNIGSFLAGWLHRGQPVSPHPVYLGRAIQPWIE